MNKVKRQTVTQGKKYTAYKVNIQEHLQIIKENTTPWKRANNRGRHSNG